MAKNVDKKLIPGYTGFIPKLKSGNNFGVGYEKLTNNFFTDNMAPFGSKNNPLDNPNPQDKFKSMNSNMYQEDPENEKILKSRPRP